MTHKEKFILFLLMLTAVLLGLALFHWGNEGFQRMRLDGAIKDGTGEPVQVTATTTTVTPTVPTATVLPTTTAGAATNAPTNNATTVAGFGINGGPNSGGTTF